MDSSFSLKDEIWFLRVCHHVSNAVYCSFVFRTTYLLKPEVIRMIHMNSVCTSQRTQPVSITKTSRLMMFSESVDVECRVTGRNVTAVSCGGDIVCACRCNRRNLMDIRRW